MRPLDRRDFVAAGAAGLIGLLGRRTLAQTPATDRLGPIGLQLYTLRDMAKKDLARTLAAVAKAGYKEVEFAGYFGHSAARVRTMLEDNGLVSPSAHVPMSDLGPVWEAVLEGANVLGQKYLAVASIDAPERTADGYKRVAQRFNEAAVKARGENIQLAYHNHTYEFIPLGGPGGYEILLAECPPENLALEMDVFWMRSAGQDPLDWLARYPGRFRMVHVKDMGPRPKNEMLDVGSGVIDWGRTISAAKKVGVKHFFVEHDEPKDPLLSIGNSYRYLRGLRFSG